MTKKFCKFTLGVHMSKIYQFGQNLKGSRHDCLIYRKMSLDICANYKNFHFRNLLLIEIELVNAS